VSSHLRPYRFVCSPYVSYRTEPSKPSKTSLRKAARAARLEKKQQERAAAKLRREASATSSQPSHSPLLGTIDHPLELSETDSPSVDDAPLPDPDQPAITNGHVEHPGRQVPVPVREPEAVQEPATVLPIPEPSEREVREDRPATQPTPLAEQREAITVPPPRLVTQPATIAPAQSDNPEKKRQNILTRTLWTFIMIGGFLGASLPLSSDLLFMSLGSSAPTRPRIHDSARYGLSNGGLSRGHSSLFHQSY